MQALLARLLDGHDLTRDEAREAMNTIMRGEATPAQIGGFLVALRLKGETADEIAGCAEAMRAHVLAHRLRAAGDLVRRLALEPERHEEGADLRGRRRAAHDLAHHLATARPLEALAVEQVGERLLDHDRSRKLRPSCGPSGVRTLSGWNWTPSIGSARWRTPITSPSGVRAVTSRSSGTRIAASE